MRIYKWPVSTSDAQCNQSSGNAIQITVRYCFIFTRRANITNTDDMEFPSGSASQGSSVVTAAAQVTTVVWVRSLARELSCAMGKAPSPQKEIFYSQKKGWRMPEKGANAKFLCRIDTMMKGTLAYFHKILKFYNFFYKLILWQFGEPECDFCFYKGNQQQQQQQKLRKGNKVSLSIAVGPV